MVLHRAHFKLILAALHVLEFFLHATDFRENQKGTETLNGRLYQRTAILYYYIISLSNQR